MMTRQMDSQEPIVIVGAACRLPGETSSLGSLWDMISQAKTGHGKVPSDRWDADTWYHPDPDRKGGISVKHGYFLQQDLKHFDAPFFSTTANEAAAMDPMKRLLLEVSYESLENAGIRVESLTDSQTGCYVGCMTNDYNMLSLREIYDLGHTAASATSHAMTANRVSWFYGLKGPSLTLDTACSSSLYALHLACQSLRQGETNMSLVAGVNLLLNPNTMHQLSAMHMLSPEGISHTFDDRANGYGRGEGIGCLVVKRLSDALRDGDTIRAVIRGTGANADGKTPSITQPSSIAQADLIRSTYAAAGLDMADTQYFECHGTGTPVGDPIELKALAATLGARRKEAHMGPLYIGSIKPNVGHTEGCSGLAGVFKALVCLENGMLVPTYGVDKVNPSLKLADWHLVLPSKTMRWPTGGQRRISVNSFGFGGANAHAILDDAYHYLASRGLVGNHNTTTPEDETDSESGISVGPATPLSESELLERQLFVFSSKDQAGVQRLSTAYANYFASPSPERFGYKYLWNLAHTLAERRTHFDFRGFCVARSVKELASQLEKGLNKTKRSTRSRGNLLFVFTGQGAQWPAMGVQLLSNPVFKESILKSQQDLDQLGCPWNAVDELQKVEGSRIGLPEFSQPLCTVLQIALVDLMAYWGVKPRATVGHSSGEIAAAYAAGYITGADAVKIAYVRGLSSAAVTIQGAMMAAGISRDVAEEYLAKVAPESAVVACVNSPSSVTLSGDVDAIDALEKMITADGKFARKLKVSTAYHSPHMRTVSGGYLEQIGELSLGVVSETANGDDETFMYSSLTGGLVKRDQLSPEYWVSNMCATVEFSAAVTGLLAHSPAKTTGSKHKKASIDWDGIIEVGPHSALKGPVQQIITAVKNKTAKEAAYMAMVLRGEDAVETSFNVAGKLWALGHPIDLAVVNGADRASSVLPPKSLTDLPPYPWNHTRTFWHEPYATKSNRFPAFPRTDLLGVPVDMQNRFEPQWRNHLRISENPWIEDHQITGTTLYPAAGMLVMALEGALQLTDKSQPLHGFRFRNVSFERGLVVPPDDEGAVETRLSFVPDRSIEGRYSFTIFSTTVANSWVRHCRGSIALEYEQPRESDVEASAANLEWTAQTRTYRMLADDDSAEDLAVEDFYEHLQTIGMEYGTLFRNVTSLKALPSAKASYGTVIIPDTISSMPKNFEYPHVMHPAAMDAIFHLLLAAFNDGRPVDEAAVPYSIYDMFVAAEQPHGAGTPFRGYGQLTSKSQGGREIIGDLVVSDDTWSSPKLTIKGFALRQVTSGGSDNHLGSGELKKCAKIEWQHGELPLLQALEASSLREALDKMDETVPKPPTEVYLLTPASLSAALAQLLSLLKDSLSSIDVVVHERDLVHLKEEDLPGKYVISLLEIDAPLVYSWSEEEFDAFKTIVSKADHLLWITKGGLLQGWSASADFAPAQGLLRVLRNEYTLTTLPHLDLSSTFDLAAPASAEIVLGVWLSSHVSNSEMEFAELAGAVHVPRIVDEPGFNAELQHAAGSPRPVPKRLGDSNLPVKFSIAADDQSCLAIEDLSSQEPLGSHDVEVAVEFIGLSTTKVTVDTSPQTWGREATGTISRVGSSVTSLHVGQVVVTLSPEAGRSALQCHESWVAPVPSYTSAKDATAMAMPLVAAQYALLEVASLRRGQHVVVNGAASDLGQAAVQIASMVGATVLALVSSKADKDILLDQGVSASHIFDSRLTNFVTAVAAATSGRGVDVVLNAKTNSATAATASVLGDFGQFLDLDTSTDRAMFGPISISKPNSSVTCIDMGRVMEARPNVVKNLFRRTFVDLCRRGIVGPLSVPTVFPIGDLAEAIKALDSPSNSRVLLAVEEDATVFMAPPPVPPLALEAEATYVLAGGLGALGLDIATMMTAHGAKHLVFLSRSGGNKNEKDLDAFRSLGVQCDVFKCDVTDANNVASVFHALKSQGRVVKGVVQCAMVLEDTIFENMTHARWQRAFLPKTRGSRNLLAQLWPQDDPWFILLSSITGVIGNTAQSNYASGNTFEDALAHHARTHLGIRATSIDVGLVSDSSHFTSAGEFGDLDNYLHRYQHGWTGLQTSLGELRIALTALMRGSTIEGPCIVPQFVLGLGDKLIRKVGGTGFERDRKFDLRVIQLEEDLSGSVKEENVSDRLKRASSLAEATEAALASLKRQIANSVGVSIDDVDTSKPLPEFGVDSLNAVEIRNRALKEMQSDISVFELLSASPVTELAAKLASRSGLLSEEVQKQE